MGETVGKIGVFFAQSGYNTQDGEQNQTNVTNENNQISL